MATRSPTLNPTLLQDASNRGALGVLGTSFETRRSRDLQVLECQACVVACEQKWYSGLSVAEAGHGSVRVHRRHGRRLADL